VDVRLMNIETDGCETRVCVPVLSEKIQKEEKRS